MAKRRKMTLFDVIHTGQPLGLQVQDRSWSSRAAPRRPFDRSASPPRGQKLSAAEELAILRRELGAKPANGLDELATDPHRADHVARAIPLEPEATATIVPPRAPRKPIGRSVRETWDVIAPKLNTAGAATARAAGVAGRGAASAANASWQQALRLRDVDTRFLMTAGLAIAAVALLGGTFYVGRLLAHRPANAITDVATVDGSTRPNVLTPIRANDANLIRTVDTKLERQPEKPPIVNSGVFGGRDASLNYVVIARYDTRADADAAVDVLAKYSVKTSVERNLPHWEKESGRDRFYVVGTEGFAKVSGTQYAKYLGSITTASEKETSNGNLPAKLTPAPYKLQRAAT